MMAFIEAKNISKVYNEGRVDQMVAIDSISLKVERKDVVVFKGPSGSGKTTLVSLIGCMGRPTAGRILVDGRDVVKLPEHFLTDIRRKHFGFIFQQFNLIREMTAAENILLPLYPLALPFATMRSRAMKLMEKLSIAGKRNIAVKHLSGGELQRVAIARALINNPEVLIADEPTAHLDKEVALRFMDFVSTFQSEGKTILIASHDPLILDSSFVKNCMEIENGRLQGGERR